MGGAQRSWGGSDTYLTRGRGASAISAATPRSSWQLFLKSICVLHALIHPEPRHYCS